MKPEKRYRGQRRNEARAYAKLIKSKLRAVWDGAEVKDRPRQPNRRSRYSPHQGAREMARRAG